jgi:hypothetical protein
MTNTQCPNKSFGLKPCELNKDHDGPCQYKTPTGLTVMWDPELMADWLAGRLDNEA